VCPNNGLITKYVGITNPVGDEVDLCVCVCVCVYTVKLSIILTAKSKVSVTCRILLEKKVEIVCLH